MTYISNSAFLVAGSYNTPMMRRMYVLSTGSAPRTAPTADMSLPALTANTSTSLKTNHGRWLVVLNPVILLLFRSPGLAAPGSTLHHRAAGVAPATHAAGGSREDAASSGGRTMLLP